MDGIEVNSLTSKVNIGLLTGLSCIIVLIAILRASYAKEHDGRKIPVELKATVLFAIVYLLIFFIFAALFHIAGEVTSILADALGQNTPQVAGNLPFFLAFTVVIGMIQLPVIRDVELWFLGWLHSASYLKKDAVALQNHILSCFFEPSWKERESNRKSLADLNVYVTDDESINSQDITIMRWRKVSTLLRLLKEWNDDKKSRVLSDTETDQLEDIVQSHRRKTELATSILRYVRGVSKKGTKNESDGTESNADTDEAEIIKELINSNINSTQGDRTDVVISGDPTKTEQTENEGKAIRISSVELTNFVQKVSGFFEEEYRTALQLIAPLAANSVIYSRGNASARLSQIREAGFIGTGYINRFSLDKLVKVLLFVTLGTFLILSMIPYVPVLVPALMSVEALKNFPQNMIPIVAGTFALATLVAALVASSRRLFTRDEVPWFIFLVTGLGAATSFYLFSATVNLIVGEKIVPNIPTGERITPEQWRNQTLFFGFVPFFLVMGICFLTRLRERHSVVEQRLIDGACTGALTFFGVACAVFCQDIADIETFGPLAHYSDPERIAIVGSVFGAIGFFIGASIVCDIRAAAQSKLVEAAHLDAEDENNTSLRTLATVEN